MVPLEVCDHSRRSHSGRKLRSSVIKVRCGTHYFPESDVVDAAGPVAVMRAVLVYSTYVFLI